MRLLVPKSVMLSPLWDVSRIEDDLRMFCLFVFSIRLFRSMYRMKWGSRRHGGTNSPLIYGFNITVV